MSEPRPDESGRDPTYVAEDAAEAGVDARTDKLKKKLKRSQKEKEEYLEGWQRERAAFSNFKKEQEKTLENFRLYAKENVLQDVLGILDAFFLAEKHAPKEIRESQWFAGLEHVKKEFVRLLEQHSVKEIETKTGDVFDPAKHYAVAEEERKSEHGSGTITEVIQKGYHMGEKVLRAVKVKVAK